MKGKTGETGLVAGSENAMNNWTHGHSARDAIENARIHNHDLKAHHIQDVVRYTQ